MWWCGVGRRGNYIIHICVVGLACALALASFPGLSDFDFDFDERDTNRETWNLAGKTERKTVKTGSFVPLAEETDM